MNEFSALRKACILAFVLLAPVVALLTPQEASANVVCLVGSAELDMGTNETGSGSIEFTCYNYGTAPESFTLCADLGNASWPGSPSQPILRGGNDFLDYNVYSDPATSQVWTQSQPLMKSVSIPGGIGTSVRGSFRFYARLSPGHSVPPGAYSGFFYNTRLGFPRGNSNTCQTWAPGGYSAHDFTLGVHTTVSNQCAVDALGDADLGSVPSSQGNAYGSTTISVSCPQGTAFAIGLKPSNGSSAGLGQLTGTTGNPETPSYQLRRGSPTGPAWGTASAVTGTGNGALQNFPVYVHVPDTNFKPDRYKDTVVVTLTF